MIGQTISHYKILEKLGEGGMGVVYKAEDTKLKRLVALKFLPSSIMASETEKARFIHEAQAAAALNHPNICTIHEIDEAEGHLFIAMEFVEGQSLKAQIESGPLKLDEALGIAVQAAEGLQAAHEKKITHRDIKPANIMLTLKGQAKIMDFGLAKLAGRSALTKEGTTMGTIPYMSPEQARGENVDHRSDIWSFGAMLYEMITGQLPFKGEYEQAVMYSIMNMDPEPITGLRTGVPMELERIVNKALAKKTSLRYQNIADMLVDLRALQMRAKPDLVTQTLVKAKALARKQIRLYGGAAVLVILLIGAAWLFWPKKQSKETFTSIAVLPFADMSSNKDQEYFCDGMTEEILTRLSKLRELKVIARTSVMRYKATDKSIKEIGAELGVATILEGSIRREGDDIRVTVQLIKVEDESHLWAENYKKKLAGVFDLQDEVSQAIAQALQVTLTPAKISALASTPPKNTAAYEYYLKGKHLFNSKYVPSLQESDFQAAVHMFNKALKSDSNYALAYVGLADACEIKYVFSGFSDPKALELSLRNAEIAVKLDPNLAEAYAVLAHVCLNTPKPDYDRVYKSLKTALRLNPNLAEANQSAGLFLWYLGLTHHAIKYFYRNLELDPFWMLSYPLSAACLMELGRLEEAAAQLQKLAEIEPDFGAGYEAGIELAALTKKYDQADSLIARAERINPRRIAWHTALLFAARGEKAKALALSQEPDVYALLGMKDEAFRSLQRYGDEHEKENRYLPLLNFPPFANLRDDPRFVAIIEKEKKKYEKNLRRYGDLGVE